MVDAVLFDLGNTLVRYYERAEFPGILERAIGGVQDYLREADLLDFSADSVWKRVEEENHESPDYAVRPMEDRLSRIFRLDSKDDKLMMAVCRRFMEPIFALAYRYDDTLPVLEELGKMGVRRRQ